MEIKPEQLASAVAEQLAEYQHLTEEILQEAVDQVGKAGQQKLKATSPKRTGAYARSWTFSRNQTKSNPHAYRRTIHARQYQLTHLLEYGHDLKRNGRVYAKARAIPHIAPVREQLAAELEERITEGIRKASK